MRRTEYLKTILKDYQIRELENAISNGVPILVAGKEIATGKSTLCDYLRSKGVNAREVWEIEEGSYKNEDNSNNSLYCLIVLNKPLQVEKRGLLADIK